MSNPNSNPDSTSRRNQDLWNSLVNPCPPYQAPLGPLNPFDPEPSNQYGRYDSARPPARRVTPTIPGTSAQRDASAYSAAIPTPRTAARESPSSPYPYYPGGIDPASLNRSPSATTNLPGAYPIGTPQPSPSQYRAALLRNQPPYLKSTVSPPPTPPLPTWNHVLTPPKPKLMIRVPKRGLDVDTDLAMNTHARKDEIRFGSNITVPENSRTNSTSNVEVENWMAAGERTMEALRLRDEGRREAKRIMLEREEWEREGARNVIEGRKKRKEEYARDTGVDDVQKGIGELRISEAQGDKSEVMDELEGDESNEEEGEEEDWEVIVGPKAGHVIVDECVDSDDSDTWY